MSKFHLHGFGKLTLETRQHLVVAIIAPLPIEFVVFELLENDQFLSRAQELWDLARDDV